MFISDQKEKFLHNRNKTSTRNPDTLKITENYNQHFQEPYENKIEYNDIDDNNKNFTESNSKFFKYIKRNMKILRNQDYNTYQNRKLMEEFNNYLHKEAENNKFFQENISYISLNNDNSNNNLTNLNNNSNNKCFNLKNEKLLNGKTIINNKQHLSDNIPIFNDNLDYIVENGSNENYDEKNFPYEAIMNNNDNEIKNYHNNSQNKIYSNRNNGKILTDGQNSYSIFDRLYNLHPLMEIKKIQMQKELAENQFKECSFNPEINDKSKKIIEKKYRNKSRPNFIERNNIFVESKMNKISKTQRENLRKIKNMSEPKISNENGDIFERLYNDNIKRKLIKENNDKLSKELDMKECTFKPEINITDLNSINNNDYAHFNFDIFLKRQKNYEKARRNKFLNKTDSFNFQHTFKPEINPNSEIIIQKNQKSGKNLSPNISTKLYNLSKTLKNKKEKIKEEYYSQFSYTPTIDHLSEIINTVNVNKNNNNINSYNSKTCKTFYKKRSYDDKIINYKIINNNLKNENYKNKDDQKNCTFRPKLYKNFKYKNISSNYKNDIDIMNRIKNELNEKIEKIDKIKKTKKNEIEYNFSPEINDSIPKSNKTVLHIKGVPKYLSNMEKSRQKKRDQKQREKEVFTTGEKWNIYKLNNVIQTQPFSFMQNQSNHNKTINTSNIKRNGKDLLKKSKSNKDVIVKLIKK